MNAAVEDERTRTPQRSVRLFGREHRVVPPSLRDPRLHVAVVLLSLQALGQTVLNFRLSIAQILACLAAGALIEFVVSLVKDRTIMWPASGLLTGNSTAFILRVPGTVHGQWWSTHGIEIFVGVVVVSMLSKYLIARRGTHVFNPSNLGLVLAFLTLGPQRVEPLDLWWVPLGPGMLGAYALLIVGGLAIGTRLRLLEMELAFLITFGGLLALGQGMAPDHCMVASWHLTPFCGQSLSQLLITSPEVLLFAFFMIPDPKSVPAGRVSRIAFGVVVAVIAVLLIGPTTVEYWTKTALLGSLVVACALRFALQRALAPLEPAGGEFPERRRFGWGLPVVLLAGLVSVACVPVSAGLSTRGPQPAAATTDGTSPTIPLVVGYGYGVEAWLSTTAAGALPPPGDAQPVGGSASTRVWVMPPVPPVTVPDNVTAFDPSMTADRATALAHDAVRDLVIEAAARRSQDPSLVGEGAGADATKIFTDYIDQDRAAGNTVTSVYSFDHVSLTLYLPKFSTQASRLVGVALTGKVTRTIRDRSGKVTTMTLDYARSWGLGLFAPDGHHLIDNEYSDLKLA